MKEKSTASGIDVEPLKPYETLLQDISIQITEIEKDLEAKNEEKNEKTEKENAAINDARNKAMENLAETMKRKSEGNDDISPKRKKTEVNRK